MKTNFIGAMLLTSAAVAWAQAEGAPRIQFERTLIDFGKTSQVASVSANFKFKNTGDALLVIEPPKPSCGCTIVGLKPDTLKPDETGELEFTLHLGRHRAQMEKHIAVKSNDPQTPEVSLAIKVDYTPLYEIIPMALVPNLPHGVNATNQFVTMTRTDAKPLRLTRLETSKPWIAAKVEPGAPGDNATARISVTIQREGPPRRFSEFVHVYTADQTNIPASSIFLYGQLMGEIALNPETLYWSLPGGTHQPVEVAEAIVLRRVVIRAVEGKAMELTNPRSSLEGIKVALVPKDPGKVYELVARLESLPTNTVSGHVSFETSLAAQPKIEVPVIVHVPPP